MSIGRVIGGCVGNHLQIRLKNNADIDVGDILIINDANNKYYLKVVDIQMSSLIPSQFIDEIAGQKLEHNVDLELFDSEDRFYRIAVAKVLKIKQADFVPPRKIPNYFSDVSLVTPEDLDFLNNTGEIQVGNLRLGMKSMDSVIISLPAKQLIRHHILISATTGKGKSNFAKVFARGLMLTDDYSAIIFDPHAEYYGNKAQKGLRDHPRAEKLLYFTSSLEENPGAEPLLIYTSDLMPSDFFGVIEFSDPQIQAMDLLFKKCGNKWIKHLIESPAEELEASFEGKVFAATIASLRRKVHYVLELEGTSGLVFTTEERKQESIFDKIVNAIRERKVIIVDTSLISGDSEKLIASSIVRKVYKYFRQAKQRNPEVFTNLPELMILFEEAPRVLGKEVLAAGSNVFERIAREGRKFKVGLCAITQMPDLLPKEILSQMNTKIILGTPSPSDRNAVVESAAQDISDESKEVQILDKGEAIIVSPFVIFPLPVKIFLFDEILKLDQKNMAKKEIKNFGID